MAKWPIGCCAQLVSEPILIHDSLLTQHLKLSDNARPLYRWDSEVYKSVSVTAAIAPPQKKPFLMLHLQSTSSARWLRQVDENLNEILIDHAHCEQKAASTAMDLMFDYVDNDALCTEMSEIVREELEHFQLVRDLLKQRGVRFHRLKPGTYGRRLKELVRRQEPQRAVDRLLVGALIEARSCERFVLLRDHLRDAPLKAFYGSLYESEARHHATYVRLAKDFASESDVNARLHDLAVAEANIIAEGCELPRVHS